MGLAGAAAATTLVAVLGAVGLLSAGQSADAASGHGQGAQRSGSVAALASAPLVDPGLGAAVQPPRSLGLPADSGTGKRVVFDISDQRVWLVDAAENVLRTYLVSGSLTANLHPGSYQVYSRSRWAVGIDDSGVMQYFVRFTRGDHAAIGFHSIPTKSGRPLQTAAQLGTPQSHGCIRAALADAQRLWDFAPVGTSVVVTA